MKPKPYLYFPLVTFGYKKVPSQKKRLNRNFLAVEYNAKTHGLHER
jgi:hypothetical protein